MGGGKNFAAPLDALRGSAFGITCADASATRERVDVLF